MAQNIQNQTPTKETSREKADRLSKWAATKLSGEIERVLATDEKYFGTISVKVQFINGQVEFVSVAHEETRK